MGKGLKNKIRITEIREFRVLGGYRVEQINEHVVDCASYKVKFIDGHYVVLSSNVGLIRIKHNKKEALDEAYDLSLSVAKYLRIECGGLYEIMDQTERGKKRELEKIAGLAPPAQ